MMLDLVCGGFIFSYGVSGIMEMLFVVMVLASMMLVRLPNDDAKQKYEMIPTGFENNFKVGVENAIDEDIERVQKQLQELVDLCAAETWRRNAIKYAEHNKLFLETHSKLIELIKKAYELYHEIFTCISDEGCWSIENGYDTWINSYIDWINERNSMGIVPCYQHTIVSIEDLQWPPRWSDKDNDYIRSSWNNSMLMEHIFDNISLTARRSRDYLGSCFTDYTNIGNWICEKSHKIITHPLLISDKSKIQPYDLPHASNCTKCSDYDGVPSPTLKETHYEPSWQEYRGAIVHPSYHVLTCVRCGSQSNGDKAGHFIDGVDFKGQSMYAGMTTHEVAMMCTCHDDPHDCYPCNSEYY
tara:strand:- start:197 stop:1264 length:1068 start_codon:yes stop_codon:yes gene_type:complete